MREKDGMNMLATEATTSEIEECPSTLGIFSRLRESVFKIITIGFSLVLSVFIVTLLTGVVTHTTPQALVESLFSGEIQFAIRLSLITSVISTVFCIIVSVPAAYALARYDFWGKNILNTILDAPLALPPLVAGVGLLILFGTTSFGKALAEAGIKFVFTPKGIVLAQFFVNMPFMFRVLRSTFQGINPRYEYVAQTLGSTESGAFWRVTLPMSKNGLMAGSIITWCRGIGEFGAALMVAGATRLLTETLPISLYLNMSCGELPLAIAAATILIMISLVSLFIFEKFSGFARSF
jgi:molybdate transport system permease protein